MFVDGQFVMNVLFLAYCVLSHKITFIVLKVNITKIFGNYCIFEWSSDVDLVGFLLT